MRSPPISAEPSERAGLTDAPVSGADAKWIATRVSGMASGASRAARLVEARMTATNVAVRTVSRMRAPISVTPPPGFVTPAVTDACPATASTSAAAPIAPMTCATM